MRENKRVAKTRFLEQKGVLRGQNLTVRFSPSDSVRLATEQLIRQDFEPHQQDLNTMLLAEGSPWTAQALIIGDADKSRRHGVLTFFLDPIGVGHFFPRVIAPTLVIVAARALPEGTTELVIAPIASRRGDPDSTYGAAPRVRDAIAAVTQIAKQSGALVSQGKRTGGFGLADPEHPASRAKISALLGWE